MIPHRGEAMTSLMDSLQPGLRALFGTERPVFLAACSATGLMEAGVRALPAGARVLSLVNGAFSERFARIAEACGHSVKRLEVDWGQVHDPESVRAAIDGHDGITVVHSETSTGALQDLAALQQAAGATPMLVDSVTGFAATPIDFDTTGLAYVCTGSQKALALPPGLALAVASEELMALAPERADRGLYLDLGAFEERQPPYTPALPQLYALQAQLERIEREGIESRYRRHAEMAHRTWEWAATRDLEILAPEGARSPSVTCLRLPPPLAGPEMAQRVAERGFVVGTGYGRLKEATFRIGHMGDQTLDTLEPLLAACDAALLNR
jgi:aspartate aminotransferase-like enzyme